MYFALQQKFNKTLNFDFSWQCPFIYLFIYFMVSNQPWISSMDIPAKIRDVFRTNTFLLKLLQTGPDLVIKSQYVIH